MALWGLALWGLALWGLALWGQTGTETGTRLVLTAIGCLGSWTN